MNENLIKNNKSNITTEEFMDSLREIQQGSLEDSHYHVMNVFLRDNGFDSDFIENANSVCQKFLGKSIDYPDNYNDDDYYEEGPYGGAFASWADFYNWKER